MLSLFPPWLNKAGNLFATLKPVQERFYNGKPVLGISEQRIRRLIENRATLVGFVFEDRNAPEQSLTFSFAKDEERVS